MISGINHITLSVHSVKISFDFYREVLGFKPLMKSSKAAYFLVGETWFCIEEDKHARTGPLPEYSHVAFSVDESSFSALSNKIIERGCTIFKENKSEGDSLYFLDPNGHKLEIHVGSWKTRLKSYKARKDLSEMAFYDE